MPATPDLNDTFGALFIGVIVSAMLFGVTCVQTFHYFQNYDSDKLLVKLFVIILLILETLHSAFNTYSIYLYTIINYGNPLALLDVNWSLFAGLVQLNITLFMVHIFYTRRVYYMSRKNVPLVALIFILALAHFGMGIFAIVQTSQIKQFSQVPQVVTYANASFSLAAATDITVAASLSFYLHKSRSGIRNTDTMINRMIIHAVNNGILTSVFEILLIIFGGTQQQNMIYLAISQIVSNLYVNSVLATLNSRQSMARAGEVTRISFGLPGSAHAISVTDEPDGTKSDVLQNNTDDVEHGSASEDAAVREYTTSTMGLANKV